jgi:hypothetical protein
MSQKFTESNISAQLRYTKALIKFCVDHEYSLDYLSSIKSCLTALENQSMKLAYEFYSKVPLGGNGCFNDWWPPVIFEHENSDYVWAVFEGLVSQWSDSMRLSIIEK